MSPFKKPTSESGLSKKTLPSKKPTSGSKLVNRLRDSLSRNSSGKNKSSKPGTQKLDPGSPISPLLQRPSATTSTSSSCSSRSYGGAGPTIVAEKSDCSEQFGSSAINSPSPSYKSSPNKFEFLPPIYSGKTFYGSSPSSASSASSAATRSTTRHSLPAGNIYPSGKLPKTGMAIPAGNRCTVLGNGKVDYGYGSIVRRGKDPAASYSTASARVSCGGGGGGGIELGNVEPEELKTAGNKEYNRGQFAKALSLYDRAIAISPENPAYRSNRAAALMALGRLVEAVAESEEAVKFDPNYGKSHRRLATLFLRLGQVENARKYLCHPGQQSDLLELQKLQTVEKHITKCRDARRIGNWVDVLGEVDAAIGAGASSSAQLFMWRAEALLKLHQIDQAENSLCHIPDWEPATLSLRQARFFGILAEAYCYVVRAQMEMACGRLENAVAAAEKANQIEPRNPEAATLLNNVRSVASAQMRGNDLFTSERFTEASTAYGEGLSLDPSNSVLYCNRAACSFMVGQWERSVEDSNHALRIWPNYTKARFRRAASNAKKKLPHDNEVLESLFRADVSLKKSFGGGGRWAEAVQDYELLWKQLPGDNEIAKALFHAQVSLKKSRGEEVRNLKFGGEVEYVSSLEQFRSAIALPGVAVVLFETASDLECKQISPFVDRLCGCYPSVNFYKVDIQTSPNIATTENLRVVPTFKIYKNGSQVKEIVCPCCDVLENSVKHYSSS